MTTYMGMGVAIPHGVNEAKRNIIFWNSYTTIP